MEKRAYQIGYLNQGIQLHAVTVYGPLCGTGKVRRFRPDITAQAPTCQRCLRSLRNGRGRYERTMVPNETPVEEANHAS